MSYLGKKIQYVLFILMVCLLLVPPAAAETLDNTGVNQTGSFVDDTVLPEATSSATLSEEVTATPTEVPPATATDEVTAEPTEEVVVASVEASSGEPVMFFNDTVTLLQGTFVAQGTDHTLNTLSPLGALDAAAEAGTFSYAITDKKWSDGYMLLDDIGPYTFIKNDTAKFSWICLLNGVEVDVYNTSYDNGQASLNNNDEVLFYYGDVKAGVTPETADAIVRIKVQVSGATPVFDGTVTLTEGTFECAPPNSENVYTVDNLTPLGALNAIATTQGFTYNITDKKYDSLGILLLNDIGSYLYNRDAGLGWTCYINNVFLDEWGSAPDNGLNKYALLDGDEVAFYYGEDAGPGNATAFVKIVVDAPSAPQPTGWTITLKGALTDTVNQDFFERGITHGHTATYTDENGEWKGMPLWYLVGLVDDDQGHGSGTFNEALAEKGYSIKVTGSDGYGVNFDSASVSMNDNIIVANTLNGTPLPETIGEKNKVCWPLRMVGSDVSAGQLVGGVATIELVGLPEPSEGWEITLAGAFNRTVSQAEFEEWVNCHGKRYTDSKDRVWTGMPIRYLVGAVDDIDSGSHWKFNDTRAAEGYTVRVTAGDGFNATFEIADIAWNDSFIVADKLNATALTADNGGPLKFVGPGLSGKQQVGGIASIVLEGLPGESTESEWTLSLEGPKVTDLFTKEEFEDCEACSHHTVTYDDGVSTWTGVTLKTLCGWVDDDVMHGSGAFNTALAQAGYTVIVSSGGENPYSKEFSSQDILTNAGNYIVASKVNGTAITGDKVYPLRLVGEGATGSLSVGNIQRIQLVDFQKPTEPPAIRIVRYASDGKTVVNETTKTCEWMEKNLKVYGEPDGIRLKFQGPTFKPDDLWNPAKDINLNKVDEVVKGTAVRDLCDLVGGVPEGGEVKLLAPDGFETKLNYTNLYTPLERQGEAIIAWWNERQGYVPDYSDGPRNFFTTPGGVFGAEDMRTCLAEDYWHYYWADGIQYPSAAGVSTKYIATIAIYPGTREDWSLTLTGAITDTMSRSYFESAKACAMAGSHSATWTDGEGQVWSGMPLWVLCGWVDDANKHDYGTNPFNDDLADAGYEITVIDYGPDGVKGTDDDFSTTFNSSFVKRNNNIIVADEIDGAPLPNDGKTWPLKLVGSALTSNKQRVGSIDEIVLTGVPIVADATISLEQGWNFVSVPRVLSAGNDNATIFANVNREKHSIWQYDAAIKDWKRVTETDPILPLEGYWIYSAGNVEVPLQFDTGVIRTPPAKALAKGWNAIGFSDTEPATARDTLLSLGDAWTQVIGHDASTQRYETSIIRGGSGNHADTQEMLPMKGYWVYLRGESELAAIGA